MRIFQLQALSWNADGSAAPATCRYVPCVRDELDAALDELGTCLQQEELVHEAGWRLQAVLDLMKGCLQDLNDCSHSGLTRAAHVRSHVPSHVLLQPPRGAFADACSPDQRESRSSRLLMEVQVNAQACKRARQA
jgi:hypothetical protein